MEFRTLHTQAGLTAITRAEATGTQINITAMAVGDGNGNPIVPQESQTSLARELYRAAPNRVWQDPTTPNKFSAELVIPASVGGFVLREVGVFTADGDLFVVGNLPETYKPQTADGAYADTVVRVDFMVSNASLVTLQVDPNVAVATQTWVSNFVTACKVIPGGTTGQTLRKKSNACGDVEWANPDASNVIVSVVEEYQTLAANQNVVTLATVTTLGLAVYIQGNRLKNTNGANGWLPDPTQPETRIILGTSYPAGAIVHLVQNDPLGSFPYPLIRGNDLSDIANKATARDNLDVYSRTETRQMAPVGEVAHFARTAAPAGWLKANGAAISRTAYADLFAVIGTTFGAGDGFSSFNLPDLRAEFICGWDDGRGIQPGRAMGSWQDSQNQAHTHGASAAVAGGHSHSATTGAAGAHSHGASSAQAGAHAHSAAVAGAGGHTHTASSAAAGQHGHTGTADSAGAHSHTVPYLVDGGGTAQPGGIVDGTPGSTIPTNAAGAHTHSLSINAAGEHAHGVTVQAVGDHAHGVTVDATTSHNHTISVDAVNAHSHDVSVAAVDSHSHSITVAESGGLQARPRNVALLACIKY